MIGVTRRARAYAAKTLPGLQHPLALAQQLEKNVKNEKTASAR